MLTFRRIGASFVLAFPVVAQTVWSVAPPADLTQVFAIAAPGDIVVLAPGVYSRFVLTKGLTVLGPATIHGLDFPPAPSTGPWNTQITVPAGQQARLLGLDFEQGNATAGISPNTPHGLDVAGDVSLEDCMIGPGIPNLLMSSGTLVMQRCTLRFGIWYGGAQVSGGTLSLSNCSLWGRHAFSNGYYAAPGEPALTITGGTFTGSALTILGGNGIYPMGYVTYHTPPTCGLRVSGTAQVRITDSVVQAGAPTGGPGAVALDSTSLAVSVARTSLQGSAGMPGSSGSVLLQGNLVGMAMNAGFTRGQTATATATAGASQQLLAVLGGFDAMPLSIAPFVGPVHGAASGVVVLALAVPPSGGTVPVSVAVPATATLLGACAWLQAIQFDGGAQWHASALVGGAIR